MYHFRLEEGVENLRTLSKRLKTTKQREFGSRLVKYIDSWWIKGPVKPQERCVYQHDSVATNNNAEGYNTKLGSNQKIKSHPNPYLLVDVLREEFVVASDDAIAEVVNPTGVQKTNRKLLTMKKRKVAMMLKLKRNRGGLDLMTYQKTMGGITLKYDGRVQETDSKEPCSNLLVRDLEVEATTEVENENHGSVEQVDVEVESRVLEAEAFVPGSSEAQVEGADPKPRKKGGKRGRKAKGRGPHGAPIQSPVGPTRAFRRIASYRRSSSCFAKSIRGSALRRKRVQQANLDRSSVTRSNPRTHALRSQVCYIVPKF